MIKVNGEEVLFETFPNGETRLVSSSIKKAFELESQEVFFKYESDADLIKLMFVKNYIDSIYQSFISLIIAYMPYSRMDRSENGSPFTLKYVTNFINSLNFNKVYVIEPHSDVTTALLNKAVPLYINYSLIDTVKYEIGFNENEDYLVFPDTGASKRYSKMKAKNVLVGHKVRDFETGEIKELDILGNTNIDSTYLRKAIIVDDLSSYGGTFVHTAVKLLELGFEVYLLVAHAENSIFKGELFDYIDKVFTTDSIVTEQNYWEHQRFEPQLKVYNLEELLK